MTFRVRGKRAVNANMKRIDHLNVRKMDPEGQGRHLFGLLDLLPIEMGTDEKKEFLIGVLAFKFWHENWSNHVNSSIEQCDADFVRLHWGCFREFLKKKSLSGLFRMSNWTDFDLCADLLGRLPDWVSYEHSKVDLRPVLKSIFKGTNESCVEQILSICKSPESLNLVSRKAV